MGRRKDSIWQYAKIVGENKFSCNFCGDEFAGGAARIKEHLGVTTRKGIHLCKNVSSFNKHRESFMNSDLPSGTSTGCTGGYPLPTNDLISDQFQDSINEREKWPMESEVPGYTGGYQLAANNLIGELFEDPIKEIENALMEDQVPEEEIQREEESKREIEEMEEDEEVTLPGFRFHPTEEELLYFYLKRKVEGKSISDELIKEKDVYKYDPWDLPRYPGTKESYFYCHPEPEYRDSGFWKVIGPDQPIFSSEGKHIGLKKSLVYYKGGNETDWMMHEYRLPPQSDSASPPGQHNRNSLHKHKRKKSLTETDSWTICKIFKKAELNSLAQNANGNEFSSENAFDKADFFASGIPGWDGDIVA